MMIRNGQNQTGYGHVWEQWSSLDACVIAALMAVVMEVMLTIITDIIEILKTQSIVQFNAVSETLN